MNDHVHPTMAAILNSFACPVGKTPAADARLIADITAGAPVTAPTTYVGNELNNAPLPPDRWREACFVESCMDGHFHVLAPDRRQFLSVGGWRVGTGAPIERLVGNFLSKDRAERALAAADKYLPADEVVRQAIIFSARQGGDTEERAERRHDPKPSV